MELSNSAYHADLTRLGSSGMKLLLKDVERFHRKYILGTEPEEKKAVFDEGSLTHALVLEPETVAKVFAFFPGLRKHGEAWERFQEENKDKIILSAAQAARCMKYVEAIKALPEAWSLFNGGAPEHSMFGTLQGIPVKARADYINVERGYIVDIKTTSYPADIECFKQTVTDLNYGLSAALYCEVAKQTYNKEFDFYFVVVSKTEFKCDVYKTSAKTLHGGIADYTRALHIFKKCTASGIWLAEQPKECYSTKNYEILEV